MLGGNRQGTRLARLFKESVPADEIPVVVGAAVPAVRQGTQGRQAFGDWADQAAIWPAVPAA
jgi:sulfite reductase beta subunit-like hemoprotein